MLPDTNQVTDVEMLKEANEALVAEEPATVETQAAKPAGVLYAVGQEPDDIRERLERLFEKLDSAYPDKVIVALTKNHGYWAETVTELYRLLGYPDSWSFLEAYGYQVKVNEENGKGGRLVPRWIRRRLAYDPRFLFRYRGAFLGPIWSYALRYNAVPPPDSRQYSRSSLGRQPWYNAS